MPRITKNKLITIIAILVVLGIVLFLGAHILTKQLVQNYDERESKIMYDRNDNVISINPNQDEYYAVYKSAVPDRFSDLLIKLILIP